jgi:dTDP-4-amino-4,6-dideoxygalactose transaminase
MSAPIHHTFGPLADEQQCALARATMRAPSRWLDGPEREELRTAITGRFRGETALFSSGREALLGILRAAGIGQGDEVIVQAYTCIVVPNAIEATGAKTVYADIDRDTLNLDIDATRGAITPNTRAVICQHTFGIPADTESLRALCDENNLLLIEDCAHALPSDDRPEGIGSRGDALLLSFGRDKAISGVSGGAAVVRAEKLKEPLRAQERDATDMDPGVIRRLLLYPLLYRAARPWYGVGIGKVMLALAGKLGLLVPIVTPEEKRGEMPAALRRLPNACAALALDQWNRLAGINMHRMGLTSFYLQEAVRRGWNAFGEGGESIIPGNIDNTLPLQKFPIFVAAPGRIRAALKKKNIHLDDGWTGCVVCPASVTETTYADGTDPTAEATCTAILSLPTHPGMSRMEAERLMRLVDAELRKGR